MKKLYSLICLLAAYFVLSQTVTITKVVDGSLSNVADCATVTAGSYPKIVELYVSGTVDFADWKLELESNGPAGTPPALSWSGSFIGNQLGIVTDQYVYLVDTGGGDIATAILPTGSKIAKIGLGINGNDAVRIVNKAGAVVDQFGDPSIVAGSSDYSFAWAYQDGFASRKTGSAPNGGTYNPSEWTFSGNNALDSKTTCSDFTSAIGLQSFLSVSDINTSKVKFIKNTLVDNDIEFTAKANVKIYNANGQLVKAASVNNGTSLNVSSLAKGIYIVSGEVDGQAVSQKIIKK